MKDIVSSEVKFRYVGASGAQSYPRTSQHGRSQQSIARLAEHCCSPIDDVSRLPFVQQVIVCPTVWLHETYAELKKHRDRLF